MEECVELTKLRREVEKEDKMEQWQTRHLRSRKKGKGDVGVEKEREKGEQKGKEMENFFCLIYEFLTDAEKFDVTNFLCNNFSDLLILLLLLLKLRPAMAGIGRPEASNTRAPS